MDVISSRRMAPLALMVLLALGACRPEWRIERPLAPSALGAVVDSVVILPFETADDVDINPAQLALFSRHLGEAAEAGTILRVFDEPPTRLPNTVRLLGQLQRRTVEDRQGEGLFLRSIALEATVTVLPVEMGNGDAPLAKVKRKIAWQKVYRGGPASSLDLDFEEAVRELSLQLVASLAPEPRGGPVVLRDGRLAGESVLRQHPALIKGNRFAVAGLYDKALRAWQQVLFDPVPLFEIRTYRISNVTLNHLRASGIAEDVLERLRPLTQESGEDLVGFRRRLRNAAGEVLDSEGLILTLADEQSAATRRVLAAAHANLAAVYEIQSRLDLATFHWAHAWANDPDPAILEHWQVLQAERKVLPGGLSDAEAIDLFLRIPPPGTASVRPGIFERTVLPPPAFPEAERMETTASAAGATERGPDVAAEALRPAGSDSVTETDGSAETAPEPGAEAESSSSDTANTPDPGSAPAAR